MVIGTTAGTTELFSFDDINCEVSAPINASGINEVGDIMSPDKSRGLNLKTRPFFIGVSGGSGAGKSFLCDR